MKASKRNGAPARKPSTRRTSPKPRKTSAKATSPRRKPTTANPPEMRQLCRQAQGINAPMGAPELCRSMYGR
ncbi:hypothetical protein [Streptomyces sp. NPDC055607]